MEPTISYNERYVPTADGALAPGAIMRTGVMDVQAEAASTRYKVLTPVAKESPDGYRYQSWPWELPPMAVTHAIIQSQNQQPTGTASVSVLGRVPEMFPYRLKAVGFVDAYRIVNRQGRLTSDTFEITP